MKKLAACLILSCCSVAGLGQVRSDVDVTNYDIKVELVPENHALKGLAKIQLKLADTTRTIPFEINSRFSIAEISDETGTQLATRFDENNNSRLLVSAEKPFPAGQKTIQIRYEGILERENYSFLDKSRVMNGYIDDQAAYLMYASRWFPMHDPLFDPAMAHVSVTVPLGFSAVVAGISRPVRTEGVSETFDWELQRPSNQLSLVVSKLREKKFVAEGIPVHIFMDEKSTGRAEAINQQLSGILAYFQRALGSYPFKQLTVVQIADEVRDEMAGPGIIYLPADLLKGPKVSDTELARRLALQWWGLDVMPQGPQDMILADGIAFYQAAQYLDTVDKSAFKDEVLKLAVLALKYENRAPISNAFSLGFRGEEYESVVGGKGAWVFYMLEDILGREKLLALLREFASENGGKQVSVSQLIAKVSALAGKDLKWFFAQWIETTGVPEMEVDYTVYKLADGSFRVEGSVRQNLELFRMPLRVAVETKEKNEIQTVQLAGKVTKFSIKSATRPVRVLLDPEQKLLRNSSEMEVAVHIALGYELFQKNQFLEAIREYERAIKLNPRSSLAHYRLGEVFFEQANTQSAGNAFRDALNGDLQPKWVESMSHLDLGKIFDMLGERQRALAEYQKVLNAKDNTFGAVDEADRYSKEAFTKKSTIMDKPDH
ncbi:MAG TPA: tetratricopeptide repeat protein [Acidobacteriota bacterium]